MFALIAVVAAVLGALAFSSAQRADRERLRAEQERTRAEGEKDRAEGEKDRADQALHRGCSRSRRSFADLARVKLLEGDAATAVNIALEAFGADERGVARPYVREAASALMVSVSSLKENAIVAHGATVRWAAFSPDGARFVTASGDGTARLSDARSGAAVATLKHDGPLERAVFSPDGKLVATTSLDRTLRLWDAATGAPVRTLTHPNAVMRVDSPAMARSW